MTDTAQLQVHPLLRVQPSASRLAHDLLPFADQAAVSAGNFLTGVILARQLDQVAFGVWILANIVVWFVLELQRGLMLNPIAVNGAALTDQRFRRFVSTSLPPNIAFILATTLITAMIETLWAPLRSVALSLSIVLLCWQAQELCRRVLFARQHVQPALLNDVVNYDVQIAPLALFAAAGALDLERALWIIAATSATATALGVWQLRRFFTREIDNIFDVARANLRVGRWTGASALLMGAGIQSYPAIVSALVGVPAAAVLGVALQLLNPMNLLIRPLQSYWAPLAIRALGRDGAAGLNRVVRRAALLTAPVYVIYVLILAALPGTVLHVVYGGRYVGEAATIGAFALLNLAFLPSQILTIEIIARRQQHAQFWAELWALLVTYTAGLYLMGHLGVLGAGLALAITGVGQGAYFAVLVWRLRHA